MGEWVDFLARLYGMFQALIIEGAGLRGGQSAMGG